MIINIAPNVDAAIITMGERVAIRKIDPIYTRVPKHDGPFLIVNIRIPAIAVRMRPGISISIIFSATVPYISDELVENTNDTASDNRNTTAETRLISNDNIGIAFFLSSRVANLMDRNIDCTM